MAQIPVIDIGPIFGPDGKDKQTSGHQVREAVTRFGFLVATGLPADFSRNGNLVQAINRFHDLPDEVKLSLARQKFAPKNRNVLRGYFPVQSDGIAQKEGIDISLHDQAWPRSDDILLEANVWPSEDQAPGWHAAMLAYGAAAETVGYALLEALSSGFDLPPRDLAKQFRHGATTLRLLRYPSHPSEISHDQVEQGKAVEINGDLYRLGTAPHTDSGCLTILNALAAPGLQVETEPGVWVNAPTIDGTLIINIGDVMAFWSGQTYRATRHRVIAQSEERLSIPLFFEPGYDTEITAPDGTQLNYADHLRDKLRNFTEFKGVKF